MLRLIACLLLIAPAATAQDARILVIGDSVMEWNGEHSVANALARALEEPVRDESVSGARFSHALRMIVGPMDVRAQVPRLPFDWVVVAAGANDLFTECECGACDDTLDDLLTADGAFGEIPDFVDLMAERGARVLWATYYDNPTIGGPATGCEAAFGTLETRIELYAAQTPALTTADMSDVIDPGDLSHYDPDRLHPSPLGSARIAQMIADTIRASK
ncbi:MAG: SGNH/GDSL hydrolase family protein [Pseudomonadota bacterium]